ncbi:Helicase-related protein [Giardia muris]|uniref:Helicase-related protein n=1 Tax=Giardia muris TaxID=5742 RepID=A0A4Z1T768_GIAMU|nr:Helicase-related protein [Giardia muris]|eukprot:TNJ28399.1 Helicase-related protein [Giardia muris]
MEPSGADLQALVGLLKTAPFEHLLRFFKRQYRQAVGQELRPEPSVVDFELDVSETRKVVSEYLQDYSTMMQEIGIPEGNVRTFLKRYEHSNTLPPFVDVLDSYYQSLDERPPSCDPIDLSTITPEMITFAPTGSKTEATSPAPNGLQMAIIEHIRTLAEQKTVVQGLLVVATGLGKTYVSMFIVEAMITRICSLQRFLNGSGDEGVVLFVVNSVMIRNQAHDKYLRYFSQRCHMKNPNEVFLNVEAGKKTVLNSRARVIFVLFQTMHVLPPTLINNVRYIVADEAHHSIAPKYRASIEEILRHPKLRLGLGMTATLTHQTDPKGARIRQLFGNTVFIDLPWTVAKRLRFFPTVRYYEYGDVSYSLLVENLRRTHIPLPDFLSRLRKSIKGGITSLSEENAPYICSDIIKRILTFQARRVMIFVSSIKEIDLFERVGREFIPENLTFLVVHYKVPKPILDERLKAFCRAPDSKSRPEQSRSLVLITVGMATEGFDLPMVDMVVLLRRTESERLFVQQMGRGLRLAPGKEAVYVLDVVSCLRTRWIRLIEEQDRDELRTQILEFWDVITLPYPSSVTLHDASVISID